MPKLTLQYIILHNEKLKCVTLLICQFNIFPTAKIAINRLIFKSITFILALKHEYLGCKFTPDIRSIISNLVI